MPSSPLDNKTGSDNIARGMPSSPLDSKTPSDNIGRGIPSWPLVNIHGQTTLAVPMPSSPLECTHGRMTSSVAYHHRPWKDTISNDVWRGMLSLPFKTHTIGRRVAWHVRMELRQYIRTDDVRRFIVRPRHALMNLGQHTRSANIRHGIPLSPLNNIHRVKRRRV